MIDLAIINAKVWTANRAAPLAQAVAAARDRIAAVGSDADVRPLIGRGTRVVDAGGRLVLPGFNDAHVHFLSGGRSLLGVRLRDARDEADFARLLRAYAAGRPKGEWITGGEWDHEAWPGHRRPTRRLIDPATPDNPALLDRLDGHIAVANSRALALAGITADTPNPPGGTIERDPSTGEPTGVLIDAAQRPVQAVVPAPSETQRREAARAAMREAARLGVTSVQSLGSVTEFGTYQQMRAAGEMTVRVYAVLSADQTAALEQVGLRAGFGDAFLRAGAVKTFVDGSLGAGSALLFEPYDDNPATCGLAIQAEEQLRELAARADAAGLQIAVHAIGDRATRMALDAFEALPARSGPGERRHRIEHAQVVAPEDRPRFARLGVVASIQPSHCTDDMRWVERRLGPRAARAYPYRSLLDAGARVAIGTDWTVEPLNPLLTLHAAVTREFPAGGPDGGWYPGEKVSLAEAVEGYTLGSAYAEFQEREKGSIEVGKLADVVVLSRDIFSIPPSELLSAQAVMTVVGGRCVYRAPEIPL